MSFSVKLYLSIVYLFLGCNKNNHFFELTEVYLKILCRIDYKFTNVSIKLIIFIEQTFLRNIYLNFVHNAVSRY